MRLADRVATRHSLHCASIEFLLYAIIEPACKRATIRRSFPASFSFFFLFSSSYFFFFSFKSLLGQYFQGSRHPVSSTSFYSARLPAGTQDHTTRRTRALTTPKPGDLRHRCTSPARLLVLAPFRPFSLAALDQALPWVARYQVSSTWTGILPDSWVYLILLPKYPAAPLPQGYAVLRAPLTAHPAHTNPPACFSVGRFLSLRVESRHSKPASVTCAAATAATHTRTL